MELATFVTVTGGADVASWRTHCGYLRFLVYFWVHLRAEQGEKSHDVPRSEAEVPPAGHVHHLLLDHLSADHDGRSESQGLAQNAVCGTEGTGRLLMSQGATAT